MRKLISVLLFVGFLFLVSAPHAQMVPGLSNPVLSFGGGPSLTQVLTTTGTTIGTMVNGGGITSCRNTNTPNFVAADGSNCVLASPSGDATLGIDLGLGQSRNWGKAIVDCTNNADCYATGTGSFQIRVSSNNSCADSTSGYVTVFNSGSRTFANSAVVTGTFSSTAGRCIIVVLPSNGANNRRASQMYFFDFE